MEFDLDHARRIVVIENSGSGKSHLADRIAGVCALRGRSRSNLLTEGSYGTRRDDAVARNLVEKAVARPASVIENVFGALCRFALQNATGLIWIDLP
jgi:adenylate kinase family enzyme